MEPSDRFFGAARPRKRRVLRGRAAAHWLVEALTAQLAPGGTLVAPVGGAQAQSLLRLRRSADGSIEQADLGPVVFVPLLSGAVDR